MSDNNQLFPHQHDLFWQEWKISPTSTAYNISLAYEIIGQLDLQRLNKAISSLIDSHDIFHAYFSEKAEKVYVNKPNKTYSDIEVIDASTSQDPNRFTAEKIKQVREHLFDLTKPPLYKITLIKVSDNHYFLALCFHHMLVDGLSETYIINFLSAAYNGETLPDSATSLEEYIQFKASSTPAISNSASSSFWQETISYINPSCNDFATIKNICSPEKSTGQFINFTINSDLTSKMKLFTQEHQSSFFSLMMTIYLITLSRISTNDDWTICYAVNVRPKELSEKIGCYTNVLPFVMSLGDITTFSQLLGKVSQLRSEQKPHQDYPFLEIVKKLRQSQQSDVRSMLNIGLMQTHVKTSSPSFDGLYVSSVPETNNDAIYDLSLEYEITKSGELQCRINYRQNYFDTDIISNFNKYFETTLEACLTSPQQSIRHFLILSSKEQKKILSDWNATSKSFHLKKMLPTLIADHTLTNPNRIALVQGDQSISYQALIERTKVLASHLKQYISNKSAFIPIVLPSGIERIVTMIAVMKAGAAYIPINPEYPSNRIAAILKDCQPQKLITSNAYQDKVSDALLLAGLSKETLFCIENESKLPSSKEALPRIAPQNIAYAIYTSGTTGEPKGIKVPHSALLNFLFGIKDLLKVNSEDNFINITPYTFDISALEIYLPLLTGSCCIIPDQKTATNGELLSKFVDQYGIQFIHTTPTNWYRLLETGWHTKINPLLICSGERLSKKLTLELLECSDSILNLYGPTETTISSTAYFIDKNTPTSPIIPIGKPLANTKVYVLDKNKQPLPVGCVGELYISGQGIADGYLNSDDLTKTRFLQKPKYLMINKKARLKRILETKPSMIYKTGDLVKWSSNGNLIYIGRNDQQIKHQGYRIELGDIECTLTDHANIQQAIVIHKKESTTGAYNLIAYYILKDKSLLLTSEDCRDYLLQRLPSYLIPDQFFLIDHAPITPNGKIDRQALYNLESTNKKITEDSSKTTERTLAEIWKNILHVKIVKPEDNFFHLGGDSISALSIVQAIENQFLVECTAQVIFDHPQLGQLSDWAESQLKSPRQGQSTAQKVERIHPIPLSAAQKRFWFLSELAARENYNILLAWKLRGIDIPLLTQAFNKLREHHHILRTIYVNEENELHQKIMDFEAISIPILSLNSSEVDAFIKKENDFAFSLSSSPPINIKLIDTQDGNHILLINMHHIIFDEKTINLFIQRLSEYYNSLYENKTIIHDTDELQYADFACWEKIYYDSSKNKSSIEFWKNFLSGFNEVTLPADYERPAELSHAGDVHSFSIDSKLLKSAKNIAHNNRTTLFSFFLSILFILIKKYTNEADLTIGVPISVRDSELFENAMGCFINTIPLRCHISDNITFTSLLSEVKKALLLTLEHKNIPFDDIVNLLQITRSANKQPLVSLLTTWEKLEDKKDLMLSGVQSEKTETPISDSKFDLHFNFIESNNDIHCKIEYATDLFKPESIERLSKHFLKLLDDFTEDSKSIISETSVLTADEYRKIVYDWNRTDVSFPKDIMLHQVFEQQVAKCPDAIALYCDQKLLTYQQLDDYANAIANVIQNELEEQDHLQPNSIIALHLKRDEFMLAAILGVLKSGAAYMPLAINLPQSRVKYMVEKSNCALIISDRPEFFEKILSTKDSTKLINAESINNKAKENLATQHLQKIATPDSPAYVIFTSGSTGLAKGTLVGHQAVVNCVFSVIHELNIKATDVFLSVTDYSFDVSVIDFFLPLAAGGSVVIASDSTRRNPEHIVKALDKYHISAMQATPTLWEMLVKVNWQGDSKFKILSAGEALNKNLTQALLKRGLVYNLYGPTEATIYATYAKIDNEHSLSIGKPLPNVKCYILDNSLKPVPNNVFGELYIGGAGLALAYLGNPELTAKRFIQNPFSLSKDERIYKTGDLVRRRNDGNIEFFGRLDDQIKLRGHRIEIGEIENQLMTHPNINAVVVLLKKDDQDSYLVAFLVPQKDASLTHQELHDYLKSRLPAYMLPKYFVERETLPITTSGKINRKALGDQFDENLLLEYEASSR